MGASTRVPPSPAIEWNQFQREMDQLLSVHLQKHLVTFESITKRQRREM
jgi:hypothetical protein